jgi:hypothetical protein
MPPVLPARPTAIFSVDVPAAAAELPTKVSVQTTAPADVTVGLLEDTVNPLGNPDIRLRLDPVAPAAARTPPTGVAVTVAVAVEVDGTEIDCGDTLSFTPGACCTCIGILLLADNPSPATATRMFPEPVAAVEAAERVSTSLFVPTLAVVGLLDHLAVRPAGSPLTE